VEKFNAAANTFRSKYNCLPGDCPNATDFGFGGTNGDGDGTIGVCSTAPACTLTANFALGGENFNFWAHLSAAGLIAGSYPAVTASPLGIAGATSFLPGIASPAPAIAAARTLQGSGWIVTWNPGLDASIGGGSFASHAFVLGTGSV